MRVCPQCGYVDPPEWRSTFNRKMDEDYTHISNFEKMFSKELVDKLKKDKTLIIEPYIYRLTKWNNVIRRWTVPAEIMRSIDQKILNRKRLKRS